MNNNIMNELQMDNIENILPIDPTQTEEAQGMQMEDFFETSLSDIESFEDNAWAKGDGLKLPNFPDRKSVV